MTKTKKLGLELIKRVPGDVLHNVRGGDGALATSTKGTSPRKTHYE